MSAQESTPPTVSELFTRIARGRAELEEWAVTLTQEQLSQPRNDGWAIKDHYIHLALWEKGMTALLRQESRYAAMGIDLGNLAPNDFDAINERLFAQHRSTSAQDALDLFYNAHMGLLSELAKLSDADLLKPYASFQPHEQRADANNPILGWIAGNTFGHYEEHTAWIRAQLAS